jgi:hypothetical protein
MSKEKELIKEITHNKFSNGKKIICLCLVIMSTYFAVQLSKSYLKSKQKEQSEKIKTLFVQPSSSKQAEKKEEVKEVKPEELTKKIGLDSKQEFRKYRVYVDIEFAKDVVVSKAIIDLKKLSGIVCTSPSVEKMTLIKVEAQDELGSNFEISLEK